MTTTTTTTTKLTTSEAVETDILSDWIVLQHVEDTKILKLKCDRDEEILYDFICHLFLFALNPFRASLCFENTFIILMAKSPVHNGKTMAACL